MPRVNDGQLITIWEFDEVVCERCNRTFTVDEHLHNVQYDKMEDEYFIVTDGTWMCKECEEEIMEKLVTTEKELAEKIQTKVDEFVQTHINSLTTSIRARGWMHKDDPSGYIAGDLSLTIFEALQMFGYIIKKYPSYPHVGYYKGERIYKKE